VTIAAFSPAEGKESDMARLESEGGGLTAAYICNIECYMKRNSRLSSILHALLHMAEQSRPMTSEALANCLGTNPVVVRRTMGLLREAGLVSSDRGHAGGWRICADLASVSLRQLHEALGEPAVFAIANRHENSACLVEQSVNAALDDAFAEAEALLLERFASVTLGDLAADFARRHEALRARKETGLVA
jgi:DNA-binding IscR family transcriptional regulator